MPRLALASLCVAIATAAHGAAAAKDTPATFESAFAVKGEPATLYYEVQFAARGATHTMQIWRDGQTRLRRRTDDALDTYVIRDRKDPTEYQMIVVDYDKRVTTRIDRNILVRLGRFMDWFDLAHGLKHPIGEYRLKAADAPPQIDAPIAPCRWYEIDQGSATNRICWSERERLPLVIWSGSRGTVWRVTAVNRQNLPADTFELQDAGFVRNDANADIDSD